MRPHLEVAHILREYGAEFLCANQPLKYHRKVLDALMKCRTAALGGHVERCESCKHERISYNSCRNRHCPKCQTTNRERWILSRKSDLLDCRYYHVVFTIPHELNTYCLQNPKALYDILFKSSKETLAVFGKDSRHLGAQTGAIAVLHTWGQNLQLHPHIHMIVPAGGITNAGKWKTTKSHGRFLFPIKAMAQVYRGKFMDYFKRFLEERDCPLDTSLRRKLYDKSWVIYAKAPFRGPDQVIEYLGRYSHKIAISNHRLKRMENGRITFSYKDYKNGGVNKVMTLDANEFLRRFCLHILPKGYRKIRYFGILASRVKPKLRLQQMSMGIQIKPTNPKKLSFKEIAKEQLNFDVEQCPCCKTGKMILLYQFAANAPPFQINDRRKAHVSS